MSGYQPERPKVVPMVHDRPKMPAKTWSALRTHILADRKKRLEKEGKIKEEERLKRERESRKKQQANNLEETKEQISMLEDKLSSLKEEKHQLFLTLKKVLNEDDVRRKKETSEMNALYPQSNSNVFPMSGHVASQHSSSRYIHPGVQQRQSLYMKPSSQPPLSHSTSIKRTRTPTPPPGSSHYPASRSTASSSSSYQQHPSNLSSKGLSLQSQAQGIMSRDILAGMGPLEREMLSKGLVNVAGADVGAGGAAIKESEAYARYLAAFQKQLEGGNKTAMAAAALSELDRVRQASQSRPGYYSHDLGSRSFPSPR